MTAGLGERSRRRNDYPIVDHHTQVRVNQAEDDLDDLEAKYDRVLSAIDEQRKSTNRLLWAVVTLSFSLVSVAVTILVTGGA